MRVTFDKKAKQLVWQLVNKSIDNKTCPFCGKKITAKNFAGAAVINDELRSFDSSILCMLELSGELKKRDKE